MRVLQSLSTKSLQLACGALLVLGACVWAAPVQAQRPLFFHSGDGRLDLVCARNGRTFSGSYRRLDGTYDPAALRAIQTIFEAPTDAPLAQISLRLVEFIDFLQDHFNRSARIEIASGWRSPEYNTRLREQGRLAATASLHQYGMAADLKISGVNSRRVWEYVRSLEFGGAGYYHGDLVHVDVGPARSWDENSSGVGTDLSADNKLICLVPEYDIYRPGDWMALRFTRMTAFPIGVAPHFTLMVRSPNGEIEKTVIRPHFSVQQDAPCPHFEDIGQMRGIRWQLPADLPPGRYVIRADFCDKITEAMPAQVTTAEFEVH